MPHCQILAKKLQSCWAWELWTLGLAIAYLLFCSSVPVNWNLALSFGVRCVMQDFALRLIVHHAVDYCMEWRRPSHWSFLLTFAIGSVTDALATHWFCNGFCSRVESVLEVCTGCYIVSVHMSLVGKRQWYSFGGYYRGRLAIEGRLDSHVMIIGA